MLDAVTDTHGLRRYLEVGKFPIARFRIAMTPKSDRTLFCDRLVLVSGPDVSFTISNSRLGNFRQPNRMHLNFLSSPRRRALFV